jgi:cyclase
MVATLPDSRHFTLEQLADGVWAAVHRIGGWAVGNAGIVDLGDATLLFDTCLTDSAARALERASYALTGRAPALVALSHYHNDHVRGAEVFPGATLVASTATRTLLRGPGHDELVSDRSHGEAHLERTRALATDADPRKRASATYFVPYWEGLVASAPRASVRLPDVTFDGAVRFHGSRRSATLASFGAAHSGDDAVLVLEDDGVVFCGDLLFNACHPYLADGDPEGWLAALDRLANTGATRFVPGHGPVGTVADVHALQAHIHGLIATVDRLRERGRTLDDLTDAMPDDESADWTFAYPFYGANLRFLMGRRGGGRG